MSCKQYHKMGVDELRAEIQQMVDKQLEGEIMMDDNLQYEMVNPYSLKRVRAGWWFGYVYHIIYEDTPIRVISDGEVAAELVRLFNVAYNEGYNRHKMDVHFEKTIYAKDA